MFGFGNKNKDKKKSKAQTEAQKAAEGGATKVTTEARQFYKPKLVDQTARDDRQGQTDKFSGELNNAVNTADTETQGLYGEQLDTNKSRLNPWQKSNYATDGGQYGRWNNRNYARTLRLAREADAYNNAPREKVQSVGTFRTGGPRDFGYAYDKPKLETMETRAMDQTVNLDTNQKQLAQSLQDAVNHKDYNAFIQAYAQRYGLVLSKEQAEVAMRQFSRQSEIQQILSKDLTQFQQEFMRGFNAETAATVYNLAGQNEKYAVLLADILLGTATPSQADIFAQINAQYFAQQYARAAGRTQVTPADWERGKAEAYRLNMTYVSEMDYYNTQAGGLLSGNKKAGKLLATGDW